MKTAYCEITRGRGRAQVNIYSEAEYREELRRRARCAAKQRRRVRTQEAVGGFIGFFGFFLLMCAGGAWEVVDIVLFGVLGLVLMVLGGWLGHAFYGQEDKAEWLRRMQERGEIE